MILQPIGSTSGFGKVHPASCPPGVLAGHAVYISGDVIAGVYQVETVDIDNSDSKKAIGVALCVSKITSISCTIQFDGLVDGVFVGLTPGRRLFVGTDGKLYETPPAYPVSGFRVVQKMGYAVGSGMLLLAPDEPMMIRA